MLHFYGTAKNNVSNNDTLPKVEPLNMMILSIIACNKYNHDNCTIDTILGITCSPRYNLPNPSSTKIHTNKQTNKQT